MLQPPRGRAVHIKDYRIVRNPADDSGNNASILNKLRPLRELIICGIESAGSFIAGANYLKQETRRGRIIW